MDAPRVANSTDFVVEPACVYGQDGERVVALVKSTWVLRQKPGRPAELVLAPAALRRGVRHADVPWGDPASSSTRLPADVAIAKPGTDVVVVADACAPGGVAAAHIDVKIVVGPLERMLRAHGRRTWLARGVGMSDAVPATRVPLRWELALGGRDETLLEEILEEPRNPVGRGILRDAARLGGAPAPQIEAVEAPVTRADQGLAPVGVGAIGPHWSPRREHTGTYDGAWLDRRAPRPPLDQDIRFAIVAAPGLHATTAFTGGERVQLANLSPWQRVIEVTLPRLRLEIAFEVRGAIVQQEVATIDTVVLDLSSEDEAASLVVELVHRASLPAPRRKRDLTVRVRELTVARPTAREASAG